MTARLPDRPVVELGFVALGLTGYLLVGWATANRTEEAVRNAREVLALEQSLGIDVEHAAQAATSGAAPWLAQLAAGFYVVGYFPVVVAATVWLYLRHRDRYRAMRTALLASGAVGLLVYALYPCAPPWMTDPRFTDTVGAGSLQVFARPPGIMNQVGAMPSFHCAWLTLAACVVFTATRSWVVRALCLALPPAMFVAVVVTGNHWVLDVPAGLLLAAVGLLVAAGMTTAHPPISPHHAARHAAATPHRAARHAGDPSPAG